MEIESNINKKDSVTKGISNYVKEKGQFNPL